MNKAAAGTESLRIVEGSVEVEGTSAMILVQADPNAVVDEEPVQEAPVEEESKGFFASFIEMIKNLFK